MIAALLYVGFLFCLIYGLWHRDRRYKHAALACAGLLVVGAAVGAWPS